MENFGIYQDIAKRTEGDIYIGVVGPVRTGKSTLIKLINDLLTISSGQILINGEEMAHLVKDMDGKLINIGIVIVIRILGIIM